LKITKNHIMTQIAKRRKPLYKKNHIAFEEKKDELIKVQVNSKTWIYVKKETGEKEIEELKKKYAPKFT
jgi:hypothetical protein